MREFEIFLYDACCYVIERGNKFLCSFVLVRKFSMDCVILC